MGLNGIQVLEPSIFLASSLTLCLTACGRATRTSPPKLRIQPKSSSVSATLRIILSRLSFNSEVSWLGREAYSSANGAAGFILPTMILKPDLAAGETVNRTSTSLSRAMRGRGNVKQWPDCLSKKRVD